MTMNKILSQDEVDALLKTIAVPPAAAPKKAEEQKAAAPPEAGAAAPPLAPRPPIAGSGRQFGSNKRVMVYNFRRPDRVPKSLLRSLQMLHDKFCANASTSLSAYLRSITEMTLLSVEQTTYAEFLLSLSDPTFFCAIGIRPLNGLAALEMNLELIFPLIDRLLGGQGNLPKLTRNITEIERNIIQGVIKLITVNLTETWRPVTHIDFNFHSSETRPQLLHIASPNEVVILVIFEVKLGETRGNMHLCIPFAALEPISGKFEQEINIRPRGNQKEDFDRISGSMNLAPVPISAELTGSLLTIRDLMTLKEGDVIKLEPKITDKISILLEGKNKFQGEVVRVQNRKGIRVTGQVLTGLA
jgi:flagellar motor switch protein FliM